MDVDAYFERIAYAGAREPTEGTLAGLHRAHMLAVPFENLDIQLGVANACLREAPPRRGRLLARAPAQPAPAATGCSTLAASSTQRCE